MSMQTETELSMRKIKNIGWNLIFGWFVGVSYLNGVCDYIKIKITTTDAFLLQHALLNRAHQDQKYKVNGVNTDFF